MSVRPYRGVNTVETQWSPRLDLAKINVTLTLALILRANITHKFNLWVTSVKIALRISSITSIIVTLVAVAVAIIATVIVILFAIRRDKEAPE